MVRAVAQLHVRRLPAHQQAGPRHDVDRGQPARPRLADAVIARVQRIQDAARRRAAGAAVAAVAAADVRVRVHQPRHDDLARHVADLGARRAPARTAAHRRDAAALHDEHAVLDGRAGNGDDVRAAERDGPFLRRGEGRGQRDAQHARRREQTGPFHDGTVRSEGVAAGRAAR
jgi:hypothetical protein